MLIYCKKCGRIIRNKMKKERICDICGCPMYPVPTQYLDLEEEDEDIKYDFFGDDMEDKFIEEFVKTSPEFDQELFDKRPYIQKKRCQEYNRMLNSHEAIRAGADPKLAFKNGGQNLPKCPACGSLNIKKIGSVERAASVGLFGLFSKKIGKTFECKNCGMMF